MHRLFSRMPNLLEPHAILKYVIFKRTIIVNKNKYYYDVEYFYCFTRKKKKYERIECIIYPNWLFLLYFFFGTRVQFQSNFNVKQICKKTYIFHFPKLIEEARSYKSRCLNKIMKSEYNF